MNQKEALDFLKQLGFVPTYVDPDIFALHLAGALTITTPNLREMKTLDDLKELLCGRIEELLQLLINEIEKAKIAIREEKKLTTRFRPPEHGIQ